MIYRGMARLFVAIIPPPTVRTEVAALAAPLEGARWIPADNVHLTLRFIGETADEKADAFAHALERVRVEPFILPVEGVGLFPSRGPARVLWAGVGAAHTRLFQLRKQVDEALLAVDASIDVHSFHPHFTAGRLTEAVDSRALARYLEVNRAFEAPPFRVDAFHLMVSSPRAGAPPAYASTRSFPLRAK